VARGAGAAQRQLCGSDIPRAVRLNNNRKES
jgi:hypothetical protein